MNFFHAENRSFLQDRKRSVRRPCLRHLSDSHIKELQADIEENEKNIDETQKQIAEKAGLCHNTIYNLEANNGAIKLETYEKVCKALGIKMSILLK
ncbi:MAG: helix-turn-helix transcriptional regulator [Ruminococcus sp.]|nr:helix-turn-helix transcriptional regulator [Ruminococcus sp.]